VITSQQQVTAMLCHSDIQLLAYKMHHFAFSHNSDELKDVLYCFWLNFIANADLCQLSQADIIISHEVLVNVIAIVSTM